MVGCLSRIVSKNGCSTTVLSVAARSIGDVSTTGCFSLIDSNCVSPASFGGGYRGTMSGIVIIDCFSLTTSKKADVANIGTVILGGKARFGLNLNSGPRFGA